MHGKLKHRIENSNQPSNGHNEKDVQVLYSDVIHVIHGTLLNVSKRKRYVYPRKHIETWKFSSPSWQCTKEVEERRTGANRKIISKMMTIRTDNRKTQIIF